MALVSGYIFYSDKSTSHIHKKSGSYSEEFYLPFPGGESSLSMGRSPYLWWHMRLTVCTVPKDGLGLVSNIS
jgi:hypothetical protein